MEVDLKRYVAAIRRRLWIVMLIAVAAAVFVGFYTLQYNPQVYAATTKLIVNKTINIVGGQQMDESSLGTSIKLIDTYKEIILTPAIMDKVEQQYPELGLSSNELIGMIGVNSLNGTQVMTLTAYSTNYVRAAKTVNAVSEVFQAEIPKIMKIDNITFLTRAKEDEPTRPFGQNLKQNVAVAFSVALMLSAGMVILLEYLDNSFKTDDEIRHALGIPLLASVPRMKKREFRKARQRKPAQALQAGEQML